MYCNDINSYYSEPLFLKSSPHIWKLLHSLLYRQTDMLATLIVTNLGSRFAHNV